MDTALYLQLIIPLLGTTLGAACVFFMKRTFSESWQRGLIGFAAGVMTAASFWSLLQPAIEQSKGTGIASVIPVLVGFWIGIAFLLLLDKAIPHIHQRSSTPEGPSTQWKKTTLLLLAVTMHNIPEGMAVGVVYAGYMTNTVLITATGALALAIGIAIQNIPEGAIISMPLRERNLSKSKSFLMGLLSGIVEPIGAIVTILFAETVVPLLPYLLSFAAGAMLYVVVEELIPEMSAGNHSHVGVITYSTGFTLMMLLDVSL